MGFIFSSRDDFCKKTPSTLLYIFPFRFFLYPHILTKCCHAHATPLGGNNIHINILKYSERTCTTKSSLKAISVFSLFSLSVSGCVSQNPDEVKQKWQKSSCNTSSIIVLFFMALSDRKHGLNRLLHLCFWKAQFILSTDSMHYKLSFFKTKSTIWENINN